MQISHPDKFVTGYHDSNGMYSCSRPLKAHYEIFIGDTVNGKDEGYIPLNLNEASKYCRTTGVF